MVDPEEVRRRATVDRYEPPVYGLEEPTWIAEVDETVSAGVGRVRVEAEGNLVAVVESHGREPGGHVKLPGPVHPGTWQNESGEGLLDRVRELLGQSAAGARG